MQNKSFLVRSVLFVVIILASYAGYNIVRHTVRKAEFARQTLSNDHIKLFSIPDSSLFFFPESDRILLMYFNSECHYCQEEIEEMVQNKDQFANIDVIFFSEETVKEISRFANRYSFNGCKNVHFTKINSNYRAALFGPIQPPTSFVYQHHILAEEIKGKAKVAEIVKWFK